MHSTALILSALMMIAMAIYMLPNVRQLNSGKILRNVAIWLVILLALALIYKSFGPGSPHPLFNLPESMQGMHGHSLTGSGS